MKVPLPDILKTKCAQGKVITERVAWKVKWLSIFFHILRICLSIFVLFTYVRCYLSPGWWIVTPPVPATATFAIFPIAVIYNIFHLDLYRRNTYHGSTAILHGVRPNHLTQTLTRTYRLHYTGELVMAIVWAVDVACLAMWPYAGKDFRNAFNRPPYLWFFCALGGAGLQVALCLIQWFMLSRERRLLKVHFGNYRHMMDGRLNEDGTLRERPYEPTQHPEHARVSYLFEDVELNDLRSPSIRTFV
ncbi:hypothetical protein MMC13_006838 [Lambiella insularis]|nr:hypothetical protein [Lambiella insularis]